MISETKNNKILIVDDEEGICKLVQGILEDEGYDVEYALNTKSALKLFSEKKFDLAILDIWLSDGSDDGIILMQELLKINTTLPIIMMSGHGTVETAVEAIKKGAYDFIEKPFKTDRLLVIVQRGIELSNLKNENNKLKNNNQDNYFMNLAGSSKALNEFKIKLNNAYNSNRHIIIFSRDTKEAVKTAKYIHSNSPISKVSSSLFDCSNANKSTTEAFFQNNKNNRAIINNIDKLPRNIENILLAHINISSYPTIFISGTVNCKSIQDTVKPLIIEIPHLSERIEDIKDLIDFSYMSNGKEAGISYKFTNEAVALLKEANWSGDISQLNNFVEWLSILGISNKTKIDKDDLSSYFRIKKNEPQKNNTISILQGDFLDVPLKPAREIFEVAYLQEQLLRFNYNISKVSSFIEMERSALHRKLKSLNIATSNDTSNKNQKTIKTAKGA